MLTDGLDSARREVPQLMQVPAATLHLCEHCTVIPFNETPILHTFIFAVLFQILICNELYNDNFTNDMRHETRKIYRFP